jgi:MSHA pilin protein MshC
VGISNSKCLSSRPLRLCGKNYYKSFGQRGFSLVELVVIIVVTVILAVIALPRLLDFSTFKEVGFYDSVKASVQYARKLAVASRRYVCVNVTSGTGFDAGFGGKVAIRQVTAVPETPGNVDCAAAAAVSLPAASTVAGCLEHEVCAPAGVKLELVGVSFIFDPLGRPVDVDRTVLGAVASLTVSTATGNQLPIVIQPNTGLVN